MVSAMKSLMQHAAPLKGSGSFIASFKVKCRPTLASREVLAVLFCIAFIAYLPGYCFAQSEIAECLGAMKPPDGRANVGIVVQDEQGNVVYSLNPDKALKPASVLKILTSLTALKVLGGDFRFQTCVYESQRKRSEVGTLFVRGGGDPGFAIEQAYLLARKLWKLGIREIGGLVIDDSLFVDDRPSQGQRAYETGSSALSFNYNSIEFDVCPAKLGQDALVTTDPWEIDVRLKGRVKTIGASRGRIEIQEISQHGASLGYNLSGTIGVSEGCAVMYRSIEDPPVYFAETFIQVLKQFSIRIANGYKHGKVPEDLSPSYCHQSRPLAAIVQDLNHFSNNFIAGQLLFALGSNIPGKWTRVLGVAELEQFLKHSGLWREEFVIADGSGLSHENRISSRAIAGLLHRASRDEGLQPEFETSLSIEGVSGTLKKRSVKNSPVILRGKTGTLDGVSSIAGYVSSSKGTKFSFAILQNEVQSRERALDFEDEFLSVLSSF